MPKPKPAPPARRPLQVAVYLRISKDPDGTSDAPDRQLDDCRKFAELRGWEIVEVFEDRDLSAYKKGVTRPAYEDLLEGLAAGEFDGVLVWRLDRLVRRTVEFSRFWTVCEDAGAVLASATQAIDTTDPIGMLVVHILVAFAEMESATTSARLRSKEAAMARAGQHKHAGRRAYGMKPGWEEIEPAEAAVIREVADRLLAGESVSSVTADLNARQIPSATGGAWSRRSLLVLMSSARLFGKREHLGEIVADGTWPTIIDEATGMRLRSLLAVKHPGADNKRRRLLSGILVCEKCGARMKANATKYRCPPKVDGGCNGTSILAAPVDDAVSEMVLLRLDSPALARVLKARSKRKSDDAQLLTELAALAAREDELMAMWAAGELTRRQLGTAKEQLELRTAEIEARLDVLRQAEPLEVILADPGGLASAWGSMPVSRRRAVIEVLVERIVVHGNGSDYYREGLRASLLEEAAEARAAGDLRLARRREVQAESRTGGGGSFRPERLEPVWRV